MLTYDPTTTSQSCPLSDLDIGKLVERLCPSRVDHRSRPCSDGPLGIDLETDERTMSREELDWCEYDG